MDLTFAGSPMASRHILSSSQEDPLEQENVPPSSPPPAALSQKPKKPPTITPKRFTRFFAPRNSKPSRSGRNSVASRRLREITKDAVNRRPATNTSRYDSFPIVSTKDVDELSTRPVKRRKYSIDLSSSPPVPISKTIKFNPSVDVFEDTPSSPTKLVVDADLDTSDLLLEACPKPIRRLPNHYGPTQRLLERSFGGYGAVSQGRMGADHSSFWQSQTCNFVSAPSDCHTPSQEEMQIPFCVANCNTNSLVAVGIENGFVRLLDTSHGASFEKPYLTFRPHKNAIMDMVFSSDDATLATASGDQTARLIDMHTQTTKSILTGHVGSLKQIRFQPGNDNIITSSSRDGSVQLWDLRCSSKASILPSSWSHYVDGDQNRVIPALASQRQLRASEAHRSIYRPVRSNPDSELSQGLSITATQHLTNGREHILLTSSEVDATIKVWDLRQAHRSRAIPLSSTSPPDTHSGRRMFGITSLALSSDGARVFAVCRDNLVYAYSTNNLVSGCSPHFDSDSTGLSGIRETKQGAAPIFAMRHDAFRNNSFYVRGALRKAHEDRSEVLAVGSSDCTPVIFPTDERCFKRRSARDVQYDELLEDEEPTLPTVSSQVSGKRVPGGSSFPIYDVGSALVGGHRKEVSQVCWAYNGDLVSIGDDYLTRCWRENATKARELRACGENGEGAAIRYGYGWATVDDPLWDEEEG